MPAVANTVAFCAPAQVAELARLVELEARWENMRSPSAPARSAQSVPQALLKVQRAYDAFHEALVNYNKRYTPRHVPESLLNTPLRLATWCLAMRDLYVQVEHDMQVHCPIHLVEKAYRGAERMSARLQTQGVARPAAPGTIRAALGHLQVVARWCEQLPGNAARTDSAADEERLKLGALLSGPVEVKAQAI